MKNDKSNFRQIKRCADPRKNQLANKGQIDKKLSLGDISKLVHELQVHQVEFEMQNEELRRAQQEIEASRNKYADLYDFAPTGYFTLDEQGIILEANLTGSVMLGVERSQLLNKPFPYYVAQDSQDIFYLHRQHVFRKKDKQSCEVALVKKDGAPWCALLESVLVADSEGTVKYCRTVVTDITERKLAEKMRQESEVFKLNKTVLDSLEAHIVVLDAQGIIVATNEPWRKFARENNLQDLQEAAEGVSYLSVCRAAVTAGVNDAMEHLQGIEDVLSGKRLLYTAEYPCHSPAEKRWFIMRVTRRMDQAGGVVIAHENITVRKRVKALMRENEARYRVLFESINDAVFVYYIKEAGVPGRFSQVNDVACQRLGYTRDELLTKTFRDITAPKAYGIMVAAKGELLSRGEVIIETVHVAKDGRKIPMESSVRLFNFLGRQAAISISRDITERKLAEATLKDSLINIRALAARLEKVREEERTRVARIVHDELGQALTGLKLDISSVAKKLSAKDVKLHAPLILKKVQSMNALITETIPIVNRIVSQLRPAMLDDLGLKAAIKWQAQNYQERTRISCSFSSNLKDQKLDRESTTGLFRILQEALNNIVRHAHATAIKILLRHKENSLIMQVSDNGRGITENKLNDFRSFGLTGMRERATLLGGAVEISGRPGIGTTVMVSIPLKKQQSLAKAQSKDA